ncbi:hypothetical protein BATDEDRAFT_26048 [Batrachochytrium dendrobatidis JAM81]|uniref:Cation/H+ exchanger domain-containing protein n=2 Tax=Batrachochytrium dendrobatidis TaxID=109871 RepID=F4P6E8_BATDJ|nr:uncharacterized protein BATDEDRAFT_26048 [Batrachochytrium dendrobatidis JAM81]EGF79597.1 hypothetical protein BATDEDRAFT_26048 [Batrachochytrium dendrobatidis JAM81]KAJ8323067.1 hypothetical protein O5D80_008575 [Batrachochytrium dendrobatidis]KAK5665615.1 hypothetical protein QVD99_007264 [Batrachochytrium dendrobatidis]OAJ42541.1 hypothetical protein BDEG_25990 [Batrachochytrium dendrobatidis JEL423]|eukprot:XP_006679938.1 hypothetical protein BATDEDRAFT_26048 [Batrachochytrium dendrobatidis JAM81]
MASIPIWVIFIAATAAFYVLFVVIESSKLIPGLNQAVQSTIEATSSNAKILTESSSIAAFISLFVIVCTGIAGGKLAERFKQAPMLGMLIAGCLVRNLFPLLIVPIPHSWTTRLWAIALASVVARAGLSIDRHTIHANLTTTLAVGIIPVCTEAIVLAGLASIVLKLPIAWAFTLAFGVASISPGVVVPLVLNIAERPEWKTNRLPPLMLAALGVDVLVSTTCFGIALSSAMGHYHEHNDWIHDAWFTRALEEIVGGLLAGTCIGFIAYMCMRNQIRDWLSFWVVFACNCIATIIGKTNGFTGAASCSTILTWAIIANSWSRPNIEAADTRLKLIWKAFKPFLFPVIGASVSFKEMPLYLFTTALLLVTISVLVKQVSCFWVTRAVNLSDEEAYFWCGMWTGKASVQATLCGAALELVHHQGLEGSPQEAHARVVFCGMISAILIGVPFASGWASSYGPGTSIPMPSTESGLCTTILPVIIPSLLSKSERKTSEDLSLRS